MGERKAADREKQSDRRASPRHRSRGDALPTPPPPSIPGRRASGRVAHPRLRGHCCGGPWRCHRLAAGGFPVPNKQPTEEGKHCGALGWEGPWHTAVLGLQARMASPGLPQGGGSPITTPQRHGDHQAASCRPESPECCLPTEPGLPPPCVHPAAAEARRGGEDRFLGKRRGEGWSSWPRVLEPSKSSGWFLPRLLVWSGREQTCRMCRMKLHNGGRGCGDLPAPRPLERKSSLPKYLY